MSVNLNSLFDAAALSDGADVLAALPVASAHPVEKAFQMAARERFYRARHAGPESALLVFT